MPMRSIAQRNFLHSRHPGIAKRFEAETPKGKQLPEHVDGMHKLASMYKGRKEK